MIRRHAVPLQTRAPGGETNAYVLDSEDERVLVDPVGRTDALDASASDIDHVALTHAHPDHVGAVDTYATAAEATVWAFEPYADRFTDETGVEPDRTFRQGDELGESGVTVMATPGHAPDHVAFLVDGDAVTGDLVFADSSVFVGAPDGDMRAYLSSLRRLYARDIDALHPGHGDPISSPRDRTRDLYFHRLDREQRILDAVRNGARTVDDVVTAAYTKDLTGVRDLAAASVRAHLDKLLVEDRLQWDGARTALAEGE